MTTNLLAGWQDSMTEIRAPHWLDQNDRRALSATILDLYEQTTVFPSLRTHLDAVLTELGVVEARDHVWPMKSEIVRLTHGYPADVLPIRMSGEELHAVLSIPTLPKALHLQLAGTAEKK